MAITIALAGNPNCGKTTMFNALTGSRQFVGNWPGVTVEKKEGKLKGNDDVVIQDLPGIYSLSPYTLEEVVARNVLIDQRPDALLNIIDATTLERNLYLTTQLVELGIPVVWNSSGYECVETLRMLDGLVQVYLPDLKYALSEPAARYSAAADYPQVARAAILEMYRQTGPFRLDEDGMLQRGVLIRHLILPQQGENTRRVIDWVGQTFAPGQVLFSLMSQYTPVGDLAQWPELQHPISPELNEEMYQYLIDSPITDGFYQDLDAATGDMIPAFDGTGV